MSEEVRERKGSRISSPEQLHDYIHVTSPSLWILLIMIIVILGAMIILAATITIENTMDVQMEGTDTASEGGGFMLMSSITGERRNQVKIGMEVRIAGEKGSITELIDNEQEVFVVAEPDRAGANLMEGIYEAVIVLERTTPISFLLEKS